MVEWHLRDESVVDTNWGSNSVVGYSNQDVERIVPHWSMILTSEIGLQYVYVGGGRQVVLESAPEGDGSAPDCAHIIYGCARLIVGSHVAPDAHVVVVHLTLLRILGQLGSHVRADGIELGGHEGRQL